MKGFFLDEDNTHTRTWCSDNMIILIIGSNMSCINVLTCTHNLFNLIIHVRFNYGANLTVRYSLNRWDQFITVGSNQDLKFDCWIANSTVQEHSKFE